MQGSNAKQTERKDLETRVKGKSREGEMDGKSNMETNNSICKIESTFYRSLQLLQTWGILIILSICLSSVQDTRNVKKNNC